MSETDEAPVPVEVPTLLDTSHDTLLYMCEDTQLHERDTQREQNFRESCKPPAWLEDAESPYKWLMSLRSSLIVDCNIPNKLMDYKNQGADYGFEKFAFLLTLASLKSLGYFYDSSSESEDNEDPEAECAEKSECEEQEEEAGGREVYDEEESYSKCQEALEEMASREGDVVYNRIGPALEHVLLATRAGMLYFNGNIAESKELAMNLKPVEEMSAENKAGFEGIRGKFILCFYNDIREALKACMRAVELDPHFGAWHYLCGKLIRRLRKEYKEKMRKEELEYFEKAVDLERNPKYLVFLAQAYQETAWLMQLEKSVHHSTINDLLKRAADLYRECWSLKNDSVTIARRVGNGLLKMSAEFQDLELAKEVLLKSNELVESTVTYHELGKYYYKYEKNDEKALECFTKAGGLFGYGEIIRMNLIKDPDYDPHELIMHWKVTALTAARRDIFNCSIGWYYLYIKKNLFMSVKYFWRVLRRDSSSFRVMKFDSYSFCVWEPINMIEVLVNEIMLFNKNKKQEAIPPELLPIFDMFDKFLEKVFEKHPEFQAMRPNPKLLETLLKGVETSIRNMRKKRYGTPGPYRCRSEPITISNWRTDDRERNEDTSERRSNEQGMRRSFRESEDVRPHSGEQVQKPWRVEDRTSSRGNTLNEGVTNTTDITRDQPFLQRIENDKETGGQGNFNQRCNSNNERRTGTEETNYRLRMSDQQGTRGRNSISRGAYSRYSFSNQGETRSGDGTYRRYYSNNNEGFNNRQGTSGEEGSASSFHNREGSSRDGMNNRQYVSNRGNMYERRGDGTRRQYDNRYDVTVTDWRRENRTKD